MNDLTFLFQYSRDVATLTNFWGRIGKIGVAIPHLHSVHWHSEMDRSITMPIHILSAAIIAWHHIETSLVSLQ